MLVLTFLLYSGLNQMIFLFRCFLLLTVSIFALYLSLCLYPDLSKASWYGITELLKISSDGNNDESQELIDSRSCLKLVSTIFYQIFIFSSNDRKNLKNYEKCFFISSKKLFSFSRYSNFRNFFPFHTFQIQKGKWKWNNL